MDDIVLRILSPVHLLLYGSLLGTELYQSFIMTKIAFQALPMAQFTSLQKKVFPIYFRIQTVLSLGLAISYPPESVKALATHWEAAVPIALTIVMSSLNCFIFGPKAQKAMIDRIHQETRDGRKYNDPDNQTVEMKQVNRRFSKMHAMSIHLNLIAILATLGYGVVLGSKLKF